MAIIDDATALPGDLKAKNYTSLVAHTSAILDEFFDHGQHKFSNDFAKYGTFIASVAEAKTSADVNAAIESAVLPVGSSSVKRETDFNIALNAYIGPTAGIEHMAALGNNPNKAVIGLTAPVGIAFSWGNIGADKDKAFAPGKKDKGGKSLTLFVSLIDVGAIATFRLGDDSTEVASEIQLKDIIAPGLSLYWGFGKCPISLGIGAQWGPQLRKIDDQRTDLNGNRNYYLRYGISLVVDIPFFNFYTAN